MVVSPALEGFRIVHFEENLIVHPHRQSAIDPIDPKPVRFSRHDFDRASNDTIVAVLVHAGQDIRRVAPSAEDDDVARGDIALVLCVGCPIAEDLDLDVALGAIAY